MKKIFKVLQDAILIVIILVIVLLLLTAFPIAKDYKLFTVISGSMEPNIHTGSLIVVKRQDQYHVGDIVTFGDFLNGQIPTTHRIVDTRLQDQIQVFQTKGDANQSTDRHEIGENRIVGKVILKIPFLGYVVDGVQKPIGFLLVIIIPAIYLVVDEIRKIFKEIKNLKQKKNKKDQEQDLEIELLEDEIEDLKKEIGKTKNKK